MSLEIAPTDQYDAHRRVSVVIPAYNAARFIGEALQSVFSQQYRDIDVIVVDDGSTDDTGALLSLIQDPRLRVIRQPNGGVSAARNRGIEACQTARIMFFDADDRLEPDAITRLNACFDQDPDIVLAYGEAATFDADGALSDGRPPALATRPQGYVLEQMIQANPISCCAVMVRRDAIQAVGGFDMRISLGEDWLTWCKLAALGRVAYAGSAPLVFYRIHAGSAARRLAKNPQAMWPAIEGVFAIPAVRTRFTESARAHLRRRAEASALAYVGRELIKDGRWQEARQAFLGALTRRPTNVGEWVLLACAVAGVLPNRIRQRIK